MRRLITVFALIAALFILMGCGMGSKESLEQGAPVPSLDPRTSDVGTEVHPIFTLFSGMYSGKNSGEIYTFDAKKEDIAELYAARQHEKEKELLTAKISDLEKKLADDAVEKTEHDKALIEGNLKVMKSSLEELNKSREGKESREALDKKVVAYHLNSFKFAIEMKEGKPEVSQLVIETAEDIEETVSVPGDTEGTTKEEKRMNRVFGNAKLQKEVKFDSNTGAFSFSFSIEVADANLVYTFEGKTSDQLIEKDEKKIREVSISGEIKISQGEKSEMVVIGNGSVYQSIDETPKKPEPVAITTQDHK